MKNTRKKNEFENISTPNPNQGVLSESLSFESFLIENSKLSGSLSREWVEAEVEKSGDYFTKEIYKKR
jgi:hypothetical protein